MADVTDWKTEVHQLRAEGLSITEIAKRVGKSRSYVGDVVTPLRCKCGAVQVKRGASRCDACRRRDDHERRMEKLRFVAWLYNHGATHREITEELGWEDASNASVLVDAARKAGFITEYRYKMENGKRVPG